MKLKIAINIRPVTGTPLPSIQARMVRPRDAEHRGFAGCPGFEGAGRDGTSANSLRDSRTRRS